MEIRRNFLALKKKYPTLPHATILSSLKNKNSLREASSYLSLLVTDSSNKTSDSFITKNIQHPQTNQKIVLSSSSPVKEPELKSSRVLLINKKSILERYRGNKQPQPQPQPQLVTPPEPKTSKRRRLVRGSSSKINYEENEISIIVLDSDDDDDQEEEEESGMDDDSDDDNVVVDDESDNDQDMDFNDRLLLFLNTCDIRDLVDIGGITPSIAQKFIDKRPFDSLETIESQDFTNDAPKPNKKPIGEKLLETATRKLNAYDTVDSLLKKCESYSNSITKEVEKWGGAKVNKEEGELEIVHVDQSDDNDDDSDDDLIIVKEGKKSQKELDSDEDSNEDSDDDFNPRKLDSNYESHRGLHLKKISGYFKQKPKLLSDEFNLKDYQQVGLNWLYLLYQKKLSCILADEMGLGKTFQVIAFLAYLKQLKTNNGPHLIVVPSSTLENWLREFQKFAPSLEVRPYYGSQDARIELRNELSTNENYDVLVTTYNLANGNKYDQNFLRSRNFNVVVYDEGHMLKNSNSDRYVKLMRIKANFRLLLTGTPLQNNLRELISLLTFILPKVFNEKKEDLQELFDQKATTNTNTQDKQQQQQEEKSNFNPLLSQQAISNAKKMMSPFVLRRKKDQVMKYLPLKIQNIEYCKMDEIQEKVYNIQIERVKFARMERLKRRTMTNEEILKLPKLEFSISPTNVLMSLRKAALHPLLFRYYYDDDKLRIMSKQIMESPEYYDANEEFIFEDMQVMSDFELHKLCQNFPRELSDFKLDINKALMQSGKVIKMMELIKNIIETRNEKLLIFSMFTQVLDILESIMSLYGYKFLRLDGQTSVDERQSIIDKFYEDDLIPIFLLSTKAGGFGINLVCANNVILFDQSFNPHDDKQAEDRAHRVGQSKEVNVYRMIVQNTIEENIYQLAENKLALDDSMMKLNDSSNGLNDKMADVFEKLLFKEEEEETM
ncbi:hypothetical protein CANARDRAFT_202705 [[Candida] arabinofermentans NRRL YB-2248]|uniref:DNA helicase n=1 Tax=[Candida] arabinofermentans NRRL YB-2248 TaxID=983967 RepID=A0A1E4SVW5_9ASCO|nr:hypothetical protein CANARDRAFT_202705 [[Candida] arabinofermentans NRRL YB-2248]